MADEDIFQALNGDSLPPGEPLSTSKPGGSFSPVSPPTPIEKRIIVWKDGIPMPATQPVLPKDQIEHLALTALSLPFEPRPLPDSATEEDRLTWEEEQKYTGLTNGEVMMIRMAKTAAGGDLAAAKELLDRILGKAKQQIESKNLKLTYTDYLKALAEKDKGVVGDVGPSNSMDVEPEENVGLDEDGDNVE